MQIPPAGVFAKSYYTRSTLIRQLSVFPKCLEIAGDILPEVARQNIRNQEKLRADNRSLNAKFDSQFDGWYDRTKLPILHTKISQESGGCLMSDLIK